MINNTNEIKQYIDNKFLELENKILKLSENLNRIKLVKDLKIEQKNTINNNIDSILIDKLPAILFDNVIVYTDFFTSSSGYTTAGTINLNGQYITLTTPATTYGEAKLIKEPLFQNIFSFQKESYFKTRIFIATNDSNKTSEVGVGKHSTNGDSFYGFKISSAVQANVSIIDPNTGVLRYSTINLFNIPSSNYTVDLQAYYYPNRKVLFRAIKQDGSIVEKEISDVLPIQFSTNKTIMYIYLQTLENVSKSLSLSYFKYVQKI